MTPGVDSFPAFLLKLFVFCDLSRLGDRRSFLEKNARTLLETNHALQDSLLRRQNVMPL